MKPVYHLALARFITRFEAAPGRHGSPDRRRIDNPCQRRPAESVGARPADAAISAEFGRSSSEVEGLDRVSPYDATPRTRPRHFPRTRPRSPLFQVVLLRVVPER